MYCSEERDSRIAEAAIDSTPASGHDQRSSCDRHDQPDDRYRSAASDTSKKANAQIIRQAELLAASTASQLIVDDLAGIDDALRYIRRDGSVRWAAITDENGSGERRFGHGRQGKYYVINLRERYCKDELPNNSAHGDR